MAKKKKTELAELIERTKANIGIKTKEEVDSIIEILRLYSISHRQQTR